MNIQRRGFIKGLMGAVATVAISTRLASAMPRLVDDELRFKATERFSHGWADSRGVFGQDVAAHKIHWSDVHDPKMWVQPITHEEFYVS